MTKEEVRDRLVDANMKLTDAKFFIRQASRSKVKDVLKIGDSMLIRACAHIDDAQNLLCSFLEKLG